MRERGQIQLSLMGWIAVGGAALFLVMYLRIQYLETQVALGEGFKAQVQANGEAAIKRAALINKENRLLKEWADADYQRLLASNAVLFDQLRERSSRSVLPSPGTVPGSLETACFGRSELDAALQRFTGGVAEIVISGQQALDDLNNAKRWANGR